MKSDQSVTGWIASYDWSIAEAERRAGGPVQYSPRPFETAYLERRYEDAVAELLPLTSGPECTDGVALCFLARCFEHNRGVDGDADRAEELYVQATPSLEQSALALDPAAMFHLAENYYNGQGGCEEKETVAQVGGNH